MSVVTRHASPLDSLETAIGFHMRDWWQPTKANFFRTPEKAADYRSP
ncbi:hypothetical protein K8R15_24660 [Escherichia coli]